VATERPHKQASKHAKQPKLIAVALIGAVGGDYDSAKVKDAETRR
jgi:hypothetical protein